MFYLFLFSISYMGCHPNPIDYLIFFREDQSPTTSHFWKSISTTRNFWIPNQKTVGNQPTKHDDETNLKYGDIMIHHERRNILIII